MRALPAIDLREGACVQLVGGRFDDERVRLPDPVAEAARWAAAGLRHQHVVDLDAALGVGENRGVIAAIARVPGLTLQVGGGVRDEAAIAALLALGVSRVIVGTRAIEDPAWLATMAQRFPSRLVVAADVREQLVVTRGWQTATALSIATLLTQLEPLPLAGLLITAVHREGQLRGIDAALYEAAVPSTRHPITASGGITDASDLATLARLGVAEAVVGMALYSGRMDPAFLAKEYAT